MSLGIRTELSGLVNGAQRRRTNVSLYRSLLSREPLELFCNVRSIDFPSCFGTSVHYHADCLTLGAVATEYTAAFAIQLHVTTFGNLIESLSSCLASICTAKNSCSGY
ncbi:hypothetical protein TNCV_2492431 [Trichonephila clavipes]|nr:hypothetical protein TNCV_2492431 [Trichonephila clavipes]